MANGPPHKLPPPRSNSTVQANTFGCEAADWAGTSGAIVLLPRGNCSFYEKVNGGAKYFSVDQSCSAGSRPFALAPIGQAVLAAGAKAAGVIFGNDANQPSTITRGRAKG